MIGRLIAHYRIEEKLGEGGMGAVYRALDTKLGRTVALKFIRGEMEISEASRRALMDEARAASALDHPNIGTIFGIEDPPEGPRFIVMAYYSGESLARRLKRGPLLIKESVSIGLQIASGLAEAHRHSLIHRDIKPSNIVLTGQGLVKIVDFGLARLVRPETSTLSASVAGTVSYMSPEQAQGRVLDTRTDLWSLGTVLYEMVSGRRAFTGENVPATLFAIVHEMPAPLGDGVPSVYRRIVDRAIAKPLQERYQTAAEIIQDLQRFSESDAPEPTVSFEKMEGDAEPAANSRLLGIRRRYLLWLLASVPVVTLGRVALTMKNANKAKAREGVKPAAYESYLAAAPYLRRYEKVENLDQAISLLKDAVKADPGFALAFAALGEAYRRKFDITRDQSLLTEAEANASRALQLNDSLARVHIVMGGVHRELGRRELAQQEFLTAIRLEPNNADALSELAGEYGASQRVPDAERLYRQAVALKPDSWGIYNDFGIFLETQEKTEEAAEQFRMVIHYAPDSVAGYLNLATALLTAGKPQQAEAPLRQALQLNPLSPVSHISLGDMYTQRGLLQEAEKETLRGIELNDKLWYAWTNLGDIYILLGRGDQAIPAYQRAVPLIEASLKIQDKDAGLWASLAEMYAYTGDKVRYPIAMQKALALDPENPSVLLRCADVHEVVGEHRLAVDLANKAVANGLRLSDLNADPVARSFRADPEFRSPIRQIAKPGLR
jgi:eukaryotic-like serine/threonine-protein kinase